jgi:predicted enzyme related to lactoylglutathione lyase
MFKKVKYSILYTKDIERAKNFYTNILNFSIIEDYGKFVELCLGDVKIALNLADREEKKPGFQTIGIISSDIENDCEFLKSNKVKVTQEMTDKGFGKTFFFEDPDGNKILVLDK